MLVVKCCYYFIVLLLLLGDHALAQTTTAKSNATLNTTATPSPESSSGLEWYWIALIVGGSVLGLILMIFAVIGCMLLMQRSQEQEQQGQTYASALQRLLGRSPPADKATSNNKVIQVSLTRPFDYAQVPNAC